MKEALSLDSISDDDILELKNLGFTVVKDKKKQINEAI